MPQRLGVTFVHFIKIWTPTILYQVTAQYECAKVSSLTCTLIVTILFPFIQLVNCKKKKWKTYKASMKFTRAVRSHQTDLCSFFFFSSCACCCKLFFFSAKVWFTLEILDWERYRFLFLQVESYKYAMYLWNIIHSTINNQAFNL